MNFNRKPMIILGWFGGAALEIVQRSPYNIDEIVKAYSDLKPDEKKNLADEDPESLARQLVASIRKLLA